MSCIHNIQAHAAKQEAKHNANMPWSRPQVKTTMESDVLAARKNRLRNRWTAQVPKPLIKGERSPLELDANETFLVSRWAVKTALVTSSVAAGGSSRDLTSLRRIKDDPDLFSERWVVFIGVQPSRNRNFSYFDRHHWPSDPAEKVALREPEIQAGTLKVSLQLRRVLLLAAYVPDFPFRFLLHAGLHVPLTVWLGEQILHTYRQPLTDGTPVDPLDILQMFHDTLGIIDI